MIKFINSYFQNDDNRGNIYGIINQLNWQEINIISSRKGSVRGGHYHKKTIELFFIIEGEIEIKAEEINEDGDIGHQKEYIVKANDIFIIEPYIIHEFKAIENCKWINALSIKHDNENPDFYKIK
tara:strand:- start:24 stop:398 length:375 start_codon:yes stop_codon:yes gene_type:complete